MTDEYSVVYMYIFSLSVHQLMDTTLVHILTIANSATRVQIFFQYTAFISSVYKSSIGIGVSYGSSIFNILRNYMFP
jgi:hypothetical protein